MDDIKRRVRKLKQLERKIRYNGENVTGAGLVWDEYFDLHAVPTGKAKYVLAELAVMSREEYKEIVDDYFARVYYAYYLENGIISVNMYSPATLAKLELPFNAGELDIKKRFRELAKEYHPDTGGDAAKFIELMQIYKELI